jgi:murein DD-endopeptidase MepM/ murein hydrolase activator NlpD
VNSEFGARPSLWSGSSEHHAGIDIGAQRGTRLVAPDAGVVAFAGAHQNYGLAMKITVSPWWITATT